MTLMFDNSRDEKSAFTLVCAQMRAKVVYDARDPQFIRDDALRAVSDPWLEKVVGPFKRVQRVAKKAMQSTETR